MKRTMKRLFMGLIVAAAVLLAALAFRPKPVAVETARAITGPLQVTIDEDGETRAHDRFTLAAPIAGKLSRIEVHEGDEVGPRAVLATLAPLPLDARESAEIRARVESAEARKREAEQQTARWETDCAQATRDLNRAKLLAHEGILPQQQLEQAQSKEAACLKDLQAARFKTQSAVAEVEKEKAGLMSLEAERDRAARTVEIRAPIRSRVLRILEKSERVVASGTPLLVLSNPQRIEIVVDLLSADAVKVKGGAAMIVENWGGPRPLRARVRVVEPYGFTKVSALGIEEQRTNVIADFLESPDGLGDGYRVDARIVIWESPSVLKVPASALFRVGASWAVFTVEAGRARQRQVQAGHRNAFEAEILDGLRQGEVVILHPSNELTRGTRVRGTGFSL